MKWKEINWVALGGSLMLLVGFFLPWVRVESIPEPIAGWQLGIYVPKLGAAYYAAYVLPLLGLLLGGLAIKKPRWASWLGIGMGSTILGWGVFEVARFLYTRTFSGLWLSLAAATLLLIGSLITWKRSKKAKALAAGTDAVTTTTARVAEEHDPVAEVPAELDEEEVPEMTAEDMAALDEALDGLE